MQTIKHFLKTFEMPTSTAIILAAIILGSSHVFYGIITQNKGGANENSGIFMGRRIDDSDFPTQNTKSDIVVVEYSDTECPFCAQIQPTILKLKENYGSDVSFVYRYFPLTQIHPGAFGEAQAAFCVGKLLGAKKRTDYIDSLFAYKISKQNMVLPEGGAEALAKNVGVNINSFRACLNSPESSDAINASIEDGIAAGVEGTPATFILRKRGDEYEILAQADGARPYEYFKAILDNALK